MLTEETPGHSQYGVGRDGASGMASASTAGHGWPPHSLQGVLSPGKTSAVRAGMAAFRSEAPFSLRPTHRASQHLLWSLECFGNIYEDAGEPWGALGSLGEQSPSFSLRSPAEVRACSLTLSPPVPGARCLSLRPVCGWAALVSTAVSCLRTGSCIFNE